MITIEQVLQGLGDDEDRFRIYLLEQIEDFLAKNHPMTEADFGHRSSRDTALISRLTLGADVSTRKFCRILQFISTYHPKEETNV